MTYESKLLNWLCRRSWFIILWTDYKMKQTRVQDETDTISFEAEKLNYVEGHGLCFFEQIIRWNIQSTR